MSQAHNFVIFLVFTLVRATGGSIIWVSSTLLLQTLTDQKLLGRILAVEYFTYSVSESITATSAGHLEDAGGNKNQISAIAAGIAAFYTSLDYLTSTKGFFVDAANCIINLIVIIGSFISTVLGMQVNKRSTGKWK
mmetsp:Transcript_10749/g.15816  ORF Transcript_10749/g.15816 Transcript_10749/m.15816 type:complete len:136 (+) Transcript_10749:147-554(+)